MRSVPPSRARSWWLLALVGAGCTPVPASLQCDLPVIDTPLPDGLAPFDLVRVNPERSEVAQGHLLINQFEGEDSYATALDGCARHVWWQASSSGRRRITRVRPSVDGETVLYAEFDKKFEYASTLHRVDPTRGEMLSETAAAEQHHDFVELGDGRLAWLAFHRPDNPWMPGLSGELVTDAVVVGEEGGRTPERLFELVSLTGWEPSWSCSHMREGYWVPGANEWSHSNSLVWRPEEQAFYVYARYLDALLRVHADGTLDWALGGDRSDFTGVGDGALPLHGHLSDAWEDQVLVFDNGTHGDPEVSRVVRYVLDPDARTWQEVWSFDDGGKHYASFLGDARLLPGGNVLVVWSPLGLLQEVTPEGLVVWEAQTEHTVGRAAFVAEWPEQ